MGKDRAVQAIKGILFDKDGTLVDFDRTWGPAVHAVMRIMAGPDEGAFRRLIEACHFIEAEMRFAPTSPLIAGSTADYGGLWAEALGRALDDDFLAELDAHFREQGLKHVTPIGNPLQVVVDLVQRGIKVGIATNDAEESAHAQIEALGLTPHLVFVAGWNSGYGRKPAPGQILAFAERFGLAPAEVCLVGDSTHDLHAARAAGAVAVAVTTGLAGHDELAPHADIVLDGIAALLDLVGRFEPAS